MLTIPKILDTPEFDKSRFIGGSLLDEHNIILITVSKDAEFMSYYSKLNFCNIADPENPLFSGVGNGNWLDEMVRYTSAEENFEGVCCLSPEGNILFVQDGKIVHKETIKEAGRWGHVAGIGLIDGQIYVCGSNGQIYHREGKGDWRHIDDSILSSTDIKTGVEERQKIRNEVINSLPEDQRTIANISRALEERKKQQKNKEIFNIKAISAQGSNNIYICGTSTTSKESGVVFHYDGKAWSKLDMPVTRGLISIHVHDADTVYIGGYEGYLFKGNYKNGFVQLAKEEIVSMGSFAAVAGRVYVSTELGLRQLKDDKITSVDIYDTINQAAPILLTENVRIDTYNNDLLIIGEKVVCCYSFDTNKIKFLLSTEIK